MWAASHTAVLVIANGDSVNAQKRLDPSTHANYFRAERSGYKSAYRGVSVIRLTKLRPWGMCLGLTVASAPRAPAQKVTEGDSASDALEEGIVTA